MFEKKSTDKQTNTADDSLGVFRPTKGSAKVVIGNGVTIKGEITNADEAQIDGNADVIINTDNLVVGSTGELKGTITSHNADVWGNIDGEVKISGTLTVQEQGTISGSVEYQNLQIKLGGKIKGDVKVSDKIKKLSDVQKKESTFTEKTDIENEVKSK